MSEFPAAPNDPALQTLVGQLRTLIRDARGNALRAVNAIQVRTCWEIGRHVVEFEQGGAVRAEYGKRLLPRLAESLTAEFGRGFDVSNFRYMRLFYTVFPIRDALRRELSWTLPPTEDELRAELERDRQLLDGTRINRKFES